MKNLVLGLMLVLNSGAIAHASERKTIDTLVTCQEYGLSDVWWQFAITKNAGGFVAHAVKSNGRMTLSLNLIAFLKKRNVNGSTVYRDDNYDDHNFVIKKEGDRLLGELMVVDSDGTVHNKTNLYCRNDSTITY